MSSKKQKQYYSGKKKKHTLKILIAANKKILFVFISKGKSHDFDMFKRSRLTLPEYIKMLADSGFQGICDYHKNSIISFKTSKKHKLSTDEKAFNRELSKKRIYIEQLTVILNVSEFYLHVIEINAENLLCVFSLFVLFLIFFEWLSNRSNIELEQAYTLDGFMEIMKEL